MYMSFSLALECLKEGYRVARHGWNGKNMWISMTPGRTLDLEKDSIWTKNVKDVAIANGGKVEILPYLSMKTVDNKIVIGWLASQTDMLANDWFIVYSDTEKEPDQEPETDGSYTSEKLNGTITSVVNLIADILDSPLLDEYDDLGKVIRDDLIMYNYMRFLRKLVRD